MGLPAVGSAGTETIRVPLAQVDGTDSLGDPPSKVLLVCYRPVTGERWDTIVDHHSDSEGSIRWGDRDTAIDLLTWGVESVAIEGDEPTPFTASDAVELWDTWPEWVRSTILAGCVRFQQTGSAADPKVRQG